MKRQTNSSKSHAGRVTLAAFSLVATIALLISSTEPASAAKGGNKGGDSNGTAYARIIVPVNNALAIQGDLEAPCIDAYNSYRYWLDLDGADTGPSHDTGCMTASGNMQVGLPGSEGLMFRTHAGTALIDGLTGTPNRYMVLEFRPLQGESCLNLDETFYAPGNFTDHPEVLDYIPTPDPNGCIDKVEATFRAGTQLFDASLTRVECIDDNSCPNLTIDQPHWNKPRGKKPATVGFPTGPTIRFRSGLDVGHPANAAGRAVRLSCTSTTNSPCVAELRQNGVVVGVYDMPFEITLVQVIVQ